MLGMTAAEACRRLGVSTVRGVIIAHNEASIRAFERSGFVHSHNEIIDGRSCNVFKYEQGM
jgi:RimJ/RimL family protein N-acetyltransferase